MNDQRQVIFSQRLKILKNNNIEEILNDFLNEILENLEKIKIIYQKSNDEKSYLASIKNTLGNSFNDEKLISITSLDKEKFYQEIKNTYLLKKQKELN